MFLLRHSVFRHSEHAIAPVAGWSRHPLKPHEQFLRSRLSGFELKPGVVSCLAPDWNDKMETRQGERLMASHISAAQMQVYRATLRHRQHQQRDHPRDYYRAVGRLQAIDARFSVDLVAVEVASEQIRQAIATTGVEL